MELLCVSDIHLKISNIETVSKWIKEENKKPDIILCSGDISNLKGKDYENEELKKKSIDDVYNILVELEKICPCCYFIPGNHDAIDFFDESFKFNKSLNSINVHSKIVKLKDNLWLGGFGGATPGYWKESKEKAWEGYPYNNEEEYSKSFKKFEIKSILQKENSIILMSHLGPSSSQTTIYQKDMTFPKINSGSNFLNDFLSSDESQNSIFLNVHGHTHPGYGRTTLGNVQTINPGSLKESKFGYLKIEKKKNGKWFLSNSQQIEFE
eukprot:gene385-6799_t